MTTTAGATARDDRSDRAPIERETGPAPDAAVIVLHGLGADGTDFVPVVDMLALPPGVSVRFVFPHAPVRAVTINRGYRMRAWYDIDDGDLSARADLDGVRDSRRLVEALIARERARGVKASRIVVAGFSQGGAIALYTGLRHTERLAAIVALSAYLIDAASLDREAAAANRDTPVFMAHGLHDAVVRLQWGQAGRDALVQRGHPVEWYTYPVGHTVALEEIAALGTFIGRVLKGSE